MKEVEDLTEAEKVVLIIACHELDYSITAHVPKKAIMNKIEKMNPKYKKKAFKSLISNGFLVEHPTGRSTTYGLTKKGFKAGSLLYKRNSES